MSSVAGFPSWLQNTSSIALILNQRRDEKIVYPKAYLAASHEVFAITLMVTWMITLIWFPEQAFEHPARPIIGSFNPCFGWDYAPASWIAVVCCSGNVYLTWRYAYLESTRTYLLSNGSYTSAQNFATFSSRFLAFASNTWLLLWLIGPNADDHPQDADGPVMVHWIFHTGIFVVYGLASFLAALGNYLEVASSNPSRIQQKNTIFIIAYGLSISYLVFVYGYDLAMYEFGQDPALSPWCTQIADIIWMGCVSSISSFLPFEPPLKVTIEVIVDEEEVKGLKSESASAA